MNPSGYYQQPAGYAYPQQQQQQQAYNPQMTAAAYSMLQQQQQQQYAASLQQQQLQQAALLQQQLQQQAMQQQQQQSPAGGQGYGKTKAPRQQSPPRVQQQQQQLAVAPVTRQPIVATAAPSIQDLIEDGSVAIKPFAPDNLDAHHNVYLLSLGGSYYRCSPKVHYVNPYDLEGANTGLTSQPLPTHKWAKVRNIMRKDLEARPRPDGADSISAEQIIAEAFPSDSISDDERVILLNPMETVIAHAEETVVLPRGVIPIVEAIPDVSRCMIDVRLSRNLGWGGEVFRPSLTITNRASHAKAVLVVGRPIAAIGLVATPHYAAQVGPGRAKSEARVKAYNAHWEPTSIINDGAVVIEPVAPQPQRQPQQPAFFRFQQQ
ncbi:hypothetical protein QKT49_gp333 [Acanthamoeba castellanii medusavirus]|uniref:Uncharacterized protein n=1 Tax=Acanthamoeba castellanii medusavirus J1 TaxID=3114988 RepID=A0A3T1CX71_9VIRU|nr:hypothetical protein QKT49_gp333 [Acanthamoeba castellanii medusavirus]BBI30430.1 hypothetical protein [Acanthamoeba castellanii medusavirus J1]